MTFYTKLFTIVKVAYSVYNDGIETGVTDPRQKKYIKYSKTIVST